MKVIRQQTWVIGLLTLISGSVWAQAWSFGPKVTLGLSSRPPVSQVQVGEVLATVGGRSGDATASGFGAFARYDRPRWYGQIEASRLRSWALGYYVSSTGLGFSGGLPRKRIDARLLSGYKPLPWLRVNAGLGIVRYTTNLSRTYQSSIDNAERLAVEFPESRDRYLAQALGYEVAQALENSVQRNGLEGQLGVGVDIGGLTVDLTHSSTLTPLINGVTVRDQSYALRQQSNLWALQVGYRLFPLKAHLLAPRKNRAYERLKRDIPFYRNEFHVSAGLLGEDIGSAFIYENRYTRYITRRFGVTGGLNLMRTYETFDNGFLPNQFTQVQLVTGLRVLPLYSRRHTIGLSLGPMLTYESGFNVSSGGSRLVNGQYVNSVNFSQNSRTNRLAADVQATLDYHFAATDRLIVGPWLRATSDYAYFGVQAGYRF